MEAAVHGGDHHTPGDWDEQVREPTLVPPRDQAHDDRTRHVRARKRAAARAAERRHLMNEIEEEVAGERRAQARRQVVRAVHRQQDEEQVAPQHHGREHQQQLAEGRPPSADVPVRGHRRNDDDVGQVAEMQVSDSGTNASRSLRYWLGCPANSADSQAGIAAVNRQSPMTAASSSTSL